MHRVESVEALGGDRLHVRFEDGTEGTIFMADRLFGPMFEPLRSPELFTQVAVDEFGAIFWPNGADLAPDSLYERLRATNLAKQPL